MSQGTTSDFEPSAKAAAFVAPMATVRLDQRPILGQGFIALAEIPTPEGAIRLANPKNTEEFARVLYVSLRVAVEKGLRKVVVTQPQGSGIAVAIRDYLSRAANGR